MNLARHHALNVSTPPPASHVLSYIIFIITHAQPPALVDTMETLTIFVKHVSVLAIHVLAKQVVYLVVKVIGIASHALITVLMVILETTKQIPAICVIQTA